MKIEECISRLEQIQKEYPDAVMAIDSEGCLNQNFEIEVSDLDDHKAVILIPSAILLSTAESEKVRGLLAKTIFDSGVNTIEALLGRELEFDSDEKMTTAIKNAINGMSDEEVMQLYNKYHN